MTQLSVFRVKQGVTDPDAILADRNSLEDFPVKVDGKHLGVLYVRRLVRKSPPWLSYFGNCVDVSGKSMSTSAVGAVLLLRHRSRTYALVFGSGRYLVAPDAIEHRFGLLTTLNAVDPARLRSVDHKRLDALSRHTREELSSAASLGQFGLDVERDLLRAVVGSPADPTVAKRLGGADQLSVVGDFPLAKLTHYLDRFSDLAGETTYKEAFPWVDNIVHVSDPSLTNELDAKLVRRLKSRASEWWLAPPEVVDWINVGSFRFRSGKKATDYVDIEFDGYYAECGSAVDLTIGRLHQDRVFCVATDDNVLPRTWSVFRCLVGELEHKGGRYVLSEGKWYSVATSFQEELKRFIADIPRSGIVFPKCSTVTEPDYLKGLRGKLPGVEFLHSSLVNFPSKGKVEVCDLYSRDKVFIHVKRCGASSVMSHMVSQGTVSAQLMVNEPLFRQEFLSKLPAASRWGDPQDPLKTSDFQVCYAIIRQPCKEFGLPFFTQVNLRTAVRTIRGLGFNVSIADIERS